MIIESELIRCYNLADSVERDIIDRMWLKYIKDEPCFYSGSMETAQPHHIRVAGACGIGLKPPDIYCIPINYIVHNNLHTKGISYVEDKFNVDTENKLKEMHNYFYYEYYAKIREVL
jgi:hypothetical protein